MITLISKCPFNLSLSLKVMANFSPESITKTRILREAVRIGEKPIVLEAKQIKKTSSLIKILTAPDNTGNNEEIKEIAEWMLFTPI